MVNEKRNIELDILRIIFAVDIILCHMSVDVSYKMHFNYIALGVEFFFLCSGFFVGKSAVREIENNDCDQVDLTVSTWKYILHKSKSIWWPFILITVFYSVILFFENKSAKWLLMSFIEGIPLFVFLNQPLHSVPAIYIRGCWYLSAMMVSSFVLYFLILRFGRPFMRIVCPICAVLLLGYLLQSNGSISATHENGLFMNLGLIRAFAEMAMGVFLYEVVKQINKFQLSRTKAVIIAIIKYIMILILLYSCLGMLDGENYYISLFLILCILLVLINWNSIPRFCLSGIGESRSALIEMYLSRISLLMYLWHGVIIHLALEYFYISGIHGTLIILAGIFGVSLVSVFIEQTIHRLYRLKKTASEHSL